MQAVHGGTHRPLVNRCAQGREAAMDRLQFAPRLASLLHGWLLCSTVGFFACGSDLVIFSRAVMPTTLRKVAQASHHIEFASQGAWGAVI